jgi:uncharacterized membrane protein YoaK (UPF0700 family)
MTAEREKSSEEATVTPFTGTPPSSGVKGSASQTAIPRSLKLGVGLVLTAVAGFVDALGYIQLGGFFASFMSGASISLGVSASGAEWEAMYHAAVLIAIFVIAAATASVISGIMRPWGIPSALLLEAACLSGATLMIESGWPSFDSVIPVVAAMGIQNTALRPIGGVRLGVTFMTGTLVSLSQAVGRSFIGREGSWTWVPHALVWCSFVAGAGSGAVLHAKYGFIALAAPTVAVWVLGGLTMSAAFAIVRRQRRLAEAS